MDRKMLRNWEHRFNEQGPDGLTDGHNDGLGERPSAAQKEELARIVEQV